MAIVLERLIPGPSQDTQRAFTGHPQRWLPGELAERGGGDLRSRLRVAGIALPVRYRVDTPWVQGDITSRRLHIDLPHYAAGLLPRTIAGDLIVEHRTDVGASLRFEPKFEWRRHSVRVPGLSHLLARTIARYVHDGIAQRLAAPPMD